jgi:hypothetical protein
MSRIMIRCWKTKKAVPTGLTTEMIILDSLGIPITVDSLMVKLNVRCPLCGSKHKWRYKDAWVEGEEPRPAYGIRGKKTASGRGTPRP